MWANSKDREFTWQYNFRSKSAFEIIPTVVFKKIFESTNYKPDVTYLFKFEK